MISICRNSVGLGVLEEEGEEKEDEDKLEKERARARYGHVTKTYQGPLKMSLKLV